MDEKNRNELEENRFPELDGDPVILPEDLTSEAMETDQPVDLDALLEDARQCADMDPQDTDPADQTQQFHPETYREVFGEELPDWQETAEQEQTEPAEETAEAPQEEQEQISMRKGRPKRKDRYGLLGIPHLLVTCFWLVLVAAIGISLGRVIWVCASDVLAFGREEKLVQVQIDNDDTIDEIAQKLHEGGLVRYPGLFKLYAGFTDAREEIGSGKFELNTIYDYHALVNAMNNYASAYEEVTITIPEGYTCQQIFALMEEKGVCSAEELENYAKDGELDDYWFLKDVKRGDKYCLEGFLFPDTYDFYVNSSAEGALEKMLDNFDAKFDDDMKASVDTLNERFASMLRNNGYGDDYIAEHRLSVRDVVTIASLVEKETAGKDESPNIASVIYNRLSNQSEWPYLNIDAALLYAIGHRDVISESDKNMDTPYNTYKYQGLIPGPIANPGMVSLKAALNPSDTNYHCYALDPATGVHHFTETLEEHNAFLEGLGDE